MILGFINSPYSIAIAPLRIELQWMALSLFDIPRPLLAIHLAPLTFFFHQSRVPPSNLPTVTLIATAFSGRLLL
jgi:hypothetical protein